MGEGQSIPNQPTMALCVDVGTFIEACIPFYSATQPLGAILLDISVSIACVLAGFGAIWVILI